MGSVLSSSKTETGTDLGKLLQSTAERFGPDAGSAVGALSESNPVAETMIKTLSEMPPAPVPDNIFDDVVGNIDEAAQELSIAVGIEKVIAYNTIKTTVQTVRKVGLAAIPVVAGLAAGVAAVETGPGAVAAAASTAIAAKQAINIAEGVQNWMIAKAKATKTPAFLKMAGAVAGKVKNGFLKFVRRFSPFSGSYDAIKRHYGMKSGACDCDFIGGAEEDVSVKSAREYLKTASSSAKTGLVKDIISTLTELLKLEPPSGLTDVEIARWLLAHMPGQEKGKNINNSPAVLKKACDKLAELINKNVGIEVIDKDLPAETICAQLSEIAHSLTVGMHLEYLVIQADLISIEANLSWLGELAEEIAATIIEKARAEMNEHERVDLINAKDAMRLTMEEIKRQMALVRALTTGTLSGVDKSISQLIKEGTFIQSGISKDSRPGDASFRDTVYKVLQGISITAAMGSLVESALKEVGIKIDEYKSFNTVSQLNDAIAKVLPGMGDTEKMHNFFKSVELLQKHFGDRKEYKMGSFDEPRYPKTEMEKKVEAKTNVIAITLRTFAKKMLALYDAFESSLKKVTHAVGTDIKIGDALKVFIDRLKLLKQDAVLSGEMYRALAGEHTDALAKQKRDEVLGTYKSLISAIDVLMSSATGAGASALTGVKESLGAMIRLSEESTVAFKKITGGADLSEAFNIDTAMKRGTLNLSKAIDAMIAYSRIAEVRRNIADAGETYKGTTSEYEQLCGQAVAGVMDDLRAEEEKIMKDLSDYRAGKTDADELKELDAVRKFFEGHFKARREFWEVVEAVEYYLANFTSDIRLRASEVNDLASLLQGVEVIKNWYDNKTGDLFTAVFDNFPVYANGTGADKVDLTEDGLNIDYAQADCVQYLPESMRNGTSTKDHYYENFADRAGSHFRAGNPYIYAHPTYGINAINVAGKALSRFAVLKNLVSIFYVLGQKYGGDKLKESSKYITPTTVYKRLMNFIQYASFYAGSKGFQLSDVQFAKIRTAWLNLMKAPVLDGGYGLLAGNVSLAAVEAIKKETLLAHDTVLYSGGNVTIHRALINFAKGLQIRGANAIRDAETTCYNAIVDAFGSREMLLAFLELDNEHFKYSDMMSTHAGVLADDAYPADGDLADLGMYLKKKTSVDDIRSRYGIFMRSCNVPSLKGSSSLIKDDQMFCQLIKAMVAKVFACVQTFEIMEKPLDYNAQNAPVRFILGAADVPLNVRPEYTELYIRLPLLVQFYRKIFTIGTEVEDNENNRYEVLDKSNSKLLKISMLPEFDGKFSGLISYMFKKAADNVTNYTNFELEKLIEKINEIIDKQSSKDPDTVIREVLSEFVREVNKKYALVTKEDVELYVKHFLHEQYTYAPNAADKYNTEVLSNIAMIDDDDISDSATLPSRSYRGIREGRLTTVLDTNALSRLKAKKFYGEYIRMVTTFRRLIDHELLESPEETPIIGKIIEGSKRQIMQEKDMNKRLDMLAKIIHGDTKLPDTEVALYTAFHEFVVNGLDVLNAAHAFISGIINVCAAIDPRNLEDIVITSMGANIGVVDPTAGVIRRANFGAHCNLDKLGTRGLNVNLVRNLIKGILGEHHQARNKAATDMRADNLTSNGAHGGLLININDVTAANRSDKTNYDINKIYDVDFTAELIIETIYALCNAKDLFDLHISKDRVSVNYSGFNEHVKRLHASIMSNADKFRPYVNKGIFDIYMDTSVIGGIYDIYDKLINHTIEGKYLSTPGGEGIKYYGLESAFEGLNLAIPAVFSGVNKGQILGRLFSKILYFDTSDRGSGLIANNTSNEPGKYNNSVNVGGHYNAFVSPVLVDWSLRKGASIERMHLATEAGKPVFDTRFAARWPHLYSWDGPLSINKSLFLGLNQIAARLLNSCFDASNEKVYKAAIAPFMRSFAQAVNNPLNDAYPDIWPGLYINEKGRILAKITEADQVVIERNPYDFARTITRPTADQSKSTFGMLSSIDAKSSSILGVTNGNYSRLYNDQLMWHDDDIRNWGGRKAPPVESLLFMSIANIVKNISSNKTSSGALLNMAESLAELTEFSKSKMREDLPLIKKYLDEFKARASLIKSIIEQWTLDLTPPVVAAAAGIYPNIEMKSGFKNETDFKEYIVRLTNKFIEVSDIFNKTIEDMSHELSITHEFGELYPGFIKSYSGSNGLLPFIPLSLATGAIALGRSVADKPWDTLVPATRDNYKKFLTNVVMSLNDPGIKNSAVIGQITDHFNKTVNGPERFQLTDIAGMIDSISKLLSHFIRGRAFKTAFTNARMDINYNRLQTEEQYRAAFPEYETGGFTEKPDMYVIVPYCPQYVVPAVAEKYPGINLYEDAIDIDHAGLIHGKFIDMNQVELFISNAPVSDVYKQYKSITETFSANGAALGGRTSLVISNIIDMNIVPIDFTGLSKFIPLNNVINYAYTLDRLALDMLVPNNLVKKSILKELMGDDSQITNTSEYIFHLIVNPFASTRGPTVPAAGAAANAPLINANSDTERLFVRNMMLGDSEAPIGRPKFMSDQIFQKTMFGEFYHANNQYNDIGHQVMPINIQRSVRNHADFTRGTTNVSNKANSYLVMNNKITGGFDAGQIDGPGKIADILGINTLIDLLNTIVASKQTLIDAEVDRLLNGNAFAVGRTPLTFTFNPANIATYIKDPAAAGPKAPPISASFNGSNANATAHLSCRMIDAATMKNYLSRLSIELTHTNTTALTVKLNFGGICVVPFSFANTGVGNLAGLDGSVPAPFDYNDAIIEKYVRPVQINVTGDQFYNGRGGAEETYPLMDAQALLINRLQSYSAEKMLDELDNIDGMWDDKVTYSSAKNSVENAVTRYLFGWEDDLDRPMNIYIADAARMAGNIETTALATTYTGQAANAITLGDIPTAQICNVLDDLRLFNAVRKLNLSERATIRFAAAYNRQGISWGELRGLMQVPNKHKILDSFSKDTNIEQLYLLIAFVLRMDFAKAEQVFLIKTKMDEVKRAFTKYATLAEVITELRIVLRDLSVGLVPGLTKASINRQAAAKLPVPTHRKLAQVMGITDKVKDLDAAIAGNAAVNMDIIANLKYVDAKRFGVGRIVDVPIPIADKLPLIAVGNYRYNTIFIRTIIFLINSYRILLFRLRQDTKNRHEAIATKPGDILDDNDTEFYGFDQYE